MRILVLGGTLFLGRHVVDVALARGHDVVLFNRSRRNPHLFPEIEKLRGDRDGDLAPLRARRFDAVIDPSGYRPEQVRAVADVLGGAIAHYTFISSISVYREFPTPLVRRGRPARGGKVLAPGRPKRPVQVVDVRDLAEWCVRLAEYSCVGVFNAVGPPSPLTMGRVLEECAAVTESPARLTWVPDEDLLAAGVKPWTELPLWIPERDARVGGMLLADNRRAVAAGLTFRPLVDTIRATVEWDRREGAAGHDLPIRVTPISPEREAELLAHYT